MNATHTLTTPYYCLIYYLSLKTDFYQIYLKKEENFIKKSLLIF